MKIAHISDIHWRGIARHKEYNQAFKQLFDELKNQKPDLIVNTGDTFHTKTQGITPEIIERLAWMFRSLADIAPSYTILGNHDGNLTNLYRKDIITPIHESIAHPNAHLLRKSGVYKLDKTIKKKDVYLCVYSPFDQKGWLEVKPTEGAINIALYHGAIAGSSMDNNWKLPGEIAEAVTKDFTQFDFALLGDIHKHQFLAKRPDKNGKLKPWMAYPGSLIQQNFGESEKKGYLIWNIKDKDDWAVKFHQLENRMPFVTIGWEGSVEKTLQTIEDKRGERAFLAGTRFRISSSAAIPSVEARKLVHSLRETKKASEVVFKYNMMSRMDHVSTNDNLKISKKSLRQDPDAVVRLYLDYLTAHIASYQFDRDALEEADQLIRGYMSKLMVRDSDKLAKTTNWSIKSLEFDNIFRYGEGNKIDFTDLEGIVGIFGPNKIGKALDIATPIPTVNGWKTIESISTDDLVFGSDGKPCRVTAKSPVFTDHQCYKVFFSDGTNIIADADHQWIVNDHKAMAYKKEHTAEHKKVTTTQQMFNNQTFNNGRVRRWSVSNCQAVQYPQRFLPIDPYVLGCWLGDGNTHNAGFTCFDEEIIDNISAAGELLLESKTKGRYTIKGLAARLRQIGVLGNKHIPKMYLIAPIEDRLALLQGLMDTDGSCSKTGLSEFLQCNQKLAKQARELISSLGFKATLRTEDAKLYGRHVSKRYRVTFTAHKHDLCPFRLTRKADRLKKLKNSFADRTKRRYITNIELCASVPVQCLVVDSPDHSFLFGKNYCVTHNSSIVGAIMYVLYNTTDRGPMKNAHIINRRKNWCRGKVRINVGGTDYIIERQSTRVVPRKRASERDPNKTTTTLNFYRIDYDELTGHEKKVVMNSVTRDDTDKEIRKLIGTSSDFLLTALSSQGSVDRFIKEGPTERKKILARFLELDIFEKLYVLCKEDYSGLNSRGNSLSPQTISNQISKMRKRIQQGENEVGALDERLCKLREQKDSVKLWLMHHEKNAADVDLAHIEELERKISLNEKTIANKDAELETLKTQLRDNEEKLKEVRASKKEINVEALKIQLDEFETLKTVLLELKAELNSQETILNNQKKNVKKLEVVPCGDQFSDCHYIKDGHRDKKKIKTQETLVEKLTNQYKTNEKTFEEYVAKKLREQIAVHQTLDRQEFDLVRTIESSKKYRELQKKEIASSRRDVKKFKAEISSLKKKVNVLEGKEYEKKKEQLDKCRDLITDVEKKRHASLVDLGGKKESLKNLLLEEEETKSLIGKLKIFDSILSAFSKTGIPAMVLKSQLPAINEELSKILEGIADFKIGLETDVLSNVMDVYIHDEHSQRIIELASGMEKTIASMALRAALINLSSLPKPDVLIIDEGFGALDETNIQSCMEMLTFLRGYFKTILVISHVTPVKEVADRILEVKNDGTESKVVA